MHDRLSSVLSRPSFYAIDAATGLVANGGAIGYAPRPKLGSANEYVDAQTQFENQVNYSPVY